MKKFLKLFLQVLALAIAILPAVPQANAQIEPQKSAFTYFGEWWNGPTGTGRWLGLKPIVEDYGLNVYGRWHGTYYGNADGGLKRAGAFDESLHILGDLDFAKLTGWEGLKGLVAHGSVRYRDGQNINNYVGTLRGFYNPSTYQGGRQWRLMPFFLTYTTPRLFGMKDFLTLSGGWHNPYLVFGIQPGANFMRNNIYTNKGLSANGIGHYSSSYAAWGGYMKLRPADWHYTAVGLFVGVPGATSTDNHGLDFAGASPASRNGVYLIGETALTPKLGPSKLPGKYAFGGYFYDAQARSILTGENHRGRSAFYWQLDQMLWREPNAVIPPPAPDGKTVQSKSVREKTPPALSDQGLNWFAWFTYAPPNENIMPFYFHTGLIYKGLIPMRDQDQIGVGFAYSKYSNPELRELLPAGQPVSYQAEVEFNYRIQVNKWAYAQPFLQYIIRPAANTSIHNATVLGVNIGINF